MTLQIRRGASTDRTSITPAAGEPIWVTDSQLLYVGDGATPGGVQVGGGGGVAISAGTNSRVTGTVNFSNSNGITFGMNTAGVVTASYTTPTQSTQPVAVSAGNGSFAFSTLTLANSNGVSFSTGTQGVYASHNGLTTQSVQTQNMVSVLGSTGNISFANSNGITFGGNASTITASHNGLTQQSTQPVAYSAANGSANFSTLSFANSNGVSFSTGTQGVYATVRTDYLTTARASNDGIGLNTAFTAGPLAMTINSAGLSLNAASAAGTTTGFTGGASISGSMTHNTAGLALSLSHPAWITTAMQSNAATISNIRVSAGTTSNLLSAITFDNSNGVSFGINGSTITATVATDYAASTHSHGNPTLALTNLSGTTASASNGFTLSLSAGAAGGGGQTKSTYIPYYPASTGTHTIYNLNSTRQSAYYFPVSVETPCIFNELRLLEFMSCVTTTVAASQTVSRTLGIYSNNANTLSLISSCSFSMAASFSSVSATLSFPTATGTGGYTYGTVTAGSTATMQSLFGTAGNRIVGYQFGNTMSLSEGLYWVGVIARNTTAGASACISMGLCGNVMAAPQNAGPIGSSTAALTTNPEYHFGWGPYTSTGSAGYGGTALPTSVFMSGIANTMTQMPMLTFISTQ